MSRADFIERRAAAKRDAILAAARARFAQEGLEGASVERIAQEAAVSTATLYRQFPSKLALFEAVMRDGLAMFEATLAAGAALPARERIAQLAQAYATLLDDPLNAGMVRAVFTAAPQSPDVARIFYEKVKSVVAGAFHAAVEAARRSGAVTGSDEPGAAGGHLMGMIEHATLWRRLLANEPGDKPPSAIANDAVAAFWKAHGVCGHE
jgi:AcrR family transcriptional regulator